MKKTNYFVSGFIHWWQYESCSIICACSLDWSLDKSLGESDSQYMKPRFHISQTMDHHSTQNIL